MPQVSIILPTFNRIDTIVRAIKSVQAQTFADWELIVVDDGSTDDTADSIDGMDPRLTLIRQDNRGFTEARNAGIRAARGDYIAFLDSDDEFLPHHLALSVAFLATFEDESFVSTELLEDFGRGRVVNHYRIETGEWYPQKAGLIGSRDMDLPPGETDDYLRVYQTREPIGAWGTDIVEPLDPRNEAFLYRGMIFEYLRYDFLIAITATVFRSSVFEVIGLPDPHWCGGSDFHFLARLCRQFRANFISLPTFIKHEFAADGALPKFGHVVSGESAMRFANEWHAAWEDLFWNGKTPDSALRSLRCLRQFWMAEVALNFGDRRAALQLLAEAREGLPRFWPAITQHWVARCLPAGPARTVSKAARKIRYALARRLVRRG